MQFAHNGYYKGSNPLGLNLYSALLCLPALWPSIPPPKGGKRPLLKGGAPSLCLDASLA